MLTHTHNFLLLLLVDNLLRVELLPRLLAQAAEVLQEEVAVDAVLARSSGELLDQPTNLERKKKKKKEKINEIYGVTEKNKNMPYIQ